MQIGLNRPICLLGRVKGTNFVGEFHILPLIHSEYPQYKYGYYMLVLEKNNRYKILNIILL